MKDIKIPNQSLKETLWHKINYKTKPVGALGQLEEIACQIGLIQQSTSPKLIKPKLLVFAADHGIALEGVSAFPQEVTFQMVMNFVAGGAAINVFCRQHNIQLQVVDAGVNYDFPPDLDIVHKKVAKGSKSFLRVAAMSQGECEQAMQAGVELVQKAHQEGSNCIGFGEMGIGNTSSASMLMHAITGIPLADCIGRGTGLDDEKLANKLRILKQAAAAHSLPPNDPLSVLQTFGGLEIAMMCGAMLEATKQQMLVLVDGFIASAAWLVTQTIAPEAKHYAVFSHQSDESGHQQMLTYLNASPLLKLNLRLGEGTGVALAYPLIESAVCFLNEMASFESAGVSNQEVLESTLE